MQSGLRYVSETPVIQRGCCGQALMLIALGAGMSAGLAYGQEIFYARDFLFTLQFNPGRDVWLQRARIMALHPRGIYVSGAFQIGASTSGGTCAVTTLPERRYGPVRSSWPTRCQLVLWTSSHGPASRLPCRKLTC